jgi:hypothetical protein
MGIHSYTLNVVQTNSTCETSDREWKEVELSNQLSNQLTGEKKVLGFRAAVHFIFHPRHPDRILCNDTSLFDSYCCYIAIDLFLVDTILCPSVYNIQKKNHPNHHSRKGTQVLEEQHKCDNIFMILM